MKMKRGGSSDSLDNGIDDLISSSSSATDFTSDDEINELYMISGQPSKNKPRSEKPLGLGSNLQRTDDKLQPSSSYDQSGHLRPVHHNICVTADGPTLNTALLTRSYYDDRYNREPPASIYGDIETSGHLERGVGLLYPDNEAEKSILPEETYTSMNTGARQVNNTTTNTAIRPHTSNRRAVNNANQVTGDTCFASSSGYENIPLDYSGEDEEDDNADLFRRPDRRVLDTGLTVAAGPSRQANQTVAAMCVRLVECRSLGEAIDFVGSNRDIIDGLTRILRDAPAYRNYDMSSYQIDHSVKESFNPEFWHDREPVVTTADGNCQYHAVSISLTGSEMYTQEVRLITAVAVIDNRDWFDSILKIIDGGTVLDLVHTIARSYSWGDATTLKAIAVAIKRRIFLYTCNIGKKDYELVKSLSKEELLDAFKEKKYRGGTGIHTYADPLIHVPVNNYIMLFHKSEHFIAVLPTTQNPTMYEPYNPIVPTFN